VTVVGRLSWARDLACCALGLVLWFVLAPQASGRSPSAVVPLVDYKHDRWPLEVGAPSRINALAQTPDGFLWIGSVEGLFRFDGVSFEKIAPSPQVSARKVVSQLHVSRRGDLWVGLARSGGVQVLRGGVLVDAGMPHPSREVNDIKEDPQGGIWIARGGRSSSTLARFYQGRWQEFGAESGLPASPVWQILFTRDGTQWVLLDDRLVLRRPGQARFEDSAMAILPRASLAQGPQGELWLADSRGLRQLDWRDGRLRVVRPLASLDEPVGGARVMFDHDGNLWETTWSSGVLRVTPQGSVSAFKAQQGLLSDQTHALAQDREGNIWIGGELGLDRLRRTKLVVEPAIPANSPTSYRMAAARDGTVYIADSSSLYAIAPHKGVARLRSLPSPAEALCADRRQGVWLITRKEALHLTAGHFTPWPKPVPGAALGCVEDGAGRLWLPMLDHGLFWREGQRWQAWPGQGGISGLPANAVVDGEGRAVILFRDGALPAGLAHKAPPFRVVASHLARVGPVEGVMAGGGMVLVSGADGLRAPFTPHTGVLAAATYPWAASLNGLVQARDGTSWGIGDVGIVRLRSADLQAALHRPGTPIAHEVFDFHDGMSSFVQKAPGAQVAEGGDGRIWFLTRSHVLRVDPAQLDRNLVRPQPLLRSIRVGGRSYEPIAGLALPAGTGAIDILFTSPSLTMPDRVQFRYRVVGQGGQWVDPGRRRVAMIRDLGPGDYTFELKVANEDGVWSQQPLSYSFSVRPAFYQHWWFWTLNGAVLVVALYALYLMRIRYLAYQIRERIEERTRERERIARELHDTLLQSVQGLIMIFQSVADRLSDHPSAGKILLPAIDRAEEVLVEGRDRVQGLRSMDDLHLHDELLRMLEKERVFSGRTILMVSKGKRLNICPSIVEDVVAIITEAARNACQHARAETIELTVEYKRFGVVLRLIDDGIGIAEGILASGGRPGHFGLLGMQERADQIGAHLSVVSTPGIGTTVTLRLPWRVADIV